MGSKPHIKPEKIQEILELLNDAAGFTQSQIAKKAGVSRFTVGKIYNKQGKFAETKITNTGSFQEVLENGNVIRPSTKGLVPASQLRAKLCQAYFYLERDKLKAKEAISYCITLVDQADSPT